jgi:hypothetical protein
MQENQNQEKLMSIGAGLMRLAEEQIGVRQVVEDRWLRGLEQYLGKYDAQTQAILQKTGGSKVFVNATRAKTAAAEARLADMLFPTDDKNWGIEPTPVPDIAPELNDDDEIAEGQTKRDIKDAVIAEAREKAKKMELLIDDQLTETNYQDKCRSVIHDACLFGTGIIKSPVVTKRTRKKWSKIDGAVYELSIEEDFTPAAEHVKIWDFFPDMSANKLDDARFVFERKYISRKQLLDLIGLPGYIEQNIRQVLAEDSQSFSASGSSYISKLRELSGLSIDLNKGRYELWEYHGPLNIDDAVLCGCDIDDSVADKEVDVIVSFIGGNVIKADMNPMETNERPYSVFTYETDDTSIFGYGVPFLVENEQRIINAAWRMVIDNAGLSTGPQVIVNRELVTPSDGSWQLKPRKIWWANSPEVDVRSAFGLFDIPSHQAELTAIYNMAKQMMDDVTNLPLLAQGEMGGAPDTATGMSMLLNSSNVVLRRIVKGFDDDLTTPVIQRFYNWNMQNSDDEEVKGDFNISARGSSALLVKETQNKALMQLLSLALQDPELRQITKIQQLFRKVAQTQHIFPDDIIMNDEEIESLQSQQAEQQPEQQINEETLIKEQTKLQIAELKAQTDIAVAQIRSGDNQAKIQTDAAVKKLSEDNKANMFIAEKQIKEQFGSGL